MAPSSVLFQPGLSAHPPPAPDKPHLPFAFPAEFGELYDLAHVAPPLHDTPPAGMPLCAWHEGSFDNSIETLQAPHKRYRVHVRSGRGRD